MASSSVNNGSVPRELKFMERENQVPEWILAREGIKLLINGKGQEAETLFLRHPDSLVMFSGYAFALMMDALMSFEEEKLTKAIATLKEVEKRCATESGWLKAVTQKIFGTNGITPSKPYSEQLETQIILADSQVCIAILTFLQQDITGYFKGGWVLRKAWKIYQKLYKEMLALYKESIGDLHLPDNNHSLASSDLSSPSSNELIPGWDTSDNLSNGYIPHSQFTNFHSFNKSESISPSKSCSNKLNSIINDKTNSKTLKKSVSIHCALTNHTRDNSWGTSLHHFHNSISFTNFTSMFSSTHGTMKEKLIEKDVIKRLMGAVSFGYGLFQLGVSLLPPSIIRLINIFGFTTDRDTGIACLMHARKGTDMRSPLATLSLLWYHTIVRPFYAIDGTNVQAGVEASLLLLEESEEEFAQSALFLFFRGRAHRLDSNIKEALGSFEQAVSNTEQREMKILCMHEIGWCHLIELDYQQAEQTFCYLKSSSRWSKVFYNYLAAICTGSSGRITNCRIFEDLKTLIVGLPKGAPLDEFLNRRFKCFPSDSKLIIKKPPIFWKLLIFEMLYLWNALPSCSGEKIESIIIECQSVSCEADEPMKGLGKLILGCSYCVQKQYDKAVDSLRKCMVSRKDVPVNAEDAHVSTFCQFELAALLLKQQETAEEGKLLLEQIRQYSQYDFEQKLHLRVHSLLKQH